MTVKDLQDFFFRRGIKVNVVEDINNTFRITTDNTLPEYIKEELEMLRPAGTSYRFVVKEIKTIPVPESAKDWYKHISKYLKK